MSVKVFYPETSNEVRQVLKMPGKVYVVPEGDSNSEVRDNYNLIRSKLRNAGFTSDEKDIKNEEGSVRSNGKFSVEVETGNEQAALMVCKILGVVNIPANKIRKMH